MEADSERDELRTARASRDVTLAILSFARNCDLSEALMPIINGKFYMNPAHGAALEQARASDSANPSSSGGGNGASSPAPARDSQGRFVPAGKVQKVEIEVGDGGYVAHVHRNPPAGQSAGSAAGDFPPRPESPHFHRPSGRRRFCWPRAGKPVDKHSSSLGIHPYETRPACGVARIHSAG